MGSNKNKKDQAIRLRRKGLSYGQILKELNLTSKGTLSGWFQDLDFTDLEKSRLEKNKSVAQKRGLFNFNKRRTGAIKEENEERVFQGKNRVLSKSFTDRELMLIGSALYWGEGTKYQGRSPRLAFTNSDPDMIRVYVKFVERILKIERSKIKAGLHIYKTIDPDEAKKYWSKVTGLDVDKFYIVFQVSRASNGKRDFHKLKYGTCVIKVGKRVDFFTVKGMIEGLVKGVLEA